MPDLFDSQKRNYCRVSFFTNSSSSVNIDYVVCRHCEEGVSSTKQSHCQRDCFRLRRGYGGQVVASLLAMTIFKHTFELGGAELFLTGESVAKEITPRARHKRYTKYQILKLLSDKWLACASLMPHMRPKLSSGTFLCENKPAGAEDRQVAG